MPTERERKYYVMGFKDGRRLMREEMFEKEDYRNDLPIKALRSNRKPKRKLSAWNKFVKANSRKKEFRYRDGKLNLKKMGVAFRRKKR